jgi:two-component system, OmpR family, sensor histidine kinase MtrB
VLRPRSLRVRIAVAYIVGSLFLSGGVALGTYGITSWVLTRQVVQSAKTQSFDELTFLKDSLELDHGPGKLRSYLQTLQQRGSELIARTRTLPAESTSASLSERAIPLELRRAVERGRVGYAIFGAEGHRQIAFGSPVPTELVRAQGRIDPVYTYFVYSLESADRTLGLLRGVLLAVVAVAGAVAGAVGLRLADRTIRPLRAAATAARKVAEGQLDTRLEVTGEDELARLVADFNRMAAALEDRIARELRFVSDASHELRTPLTALKTSIDYIATKSKELPAGLRGAVGLAADEVRSLGRLVDDLLELTRAEAGSIQVSWEEVDLRDFATQLVRRRAPNTPVEIEGPEQLIVRTDKMRLERVVGNLVENAVMHGGGERVRIALDTVDGIARISVADQGPGITPEQVPNIFDRFWRGDISRQRDGRVGSGLGLAIARENAKLIGADLRVESVVGEGTRFEVVLPRERAR